MVIWESAGTGDPGDQWGASAINGAEWLVGPAGDGQWGVELIQRDANGAEVETTDLGQRFPTEEDAKAAAGRYETLRCAETHNPGVWPYVARCVQSASAHTWHEDAKGRGWST